MINQFLHYDGDLWQLLLVEKQNETARSPYSLKVGPKMKKNIPVFSTTKIFFFNS